MKNLFLLILILFIAIIIIILYANITTMIWTLLIATGLLIILFIDEIIKQRKQ